MRRLFVDWPEIQPAMRSDPKGIRSSDVFLTGRHNFFASGARSCRHRIFLIFVTSALASRVS